LGSSRCARVPAGSLANASLVGAKTVNGPSPESVSTSLPALRAATRVDRSGVAAARATIFLVSAGTGGMPDGIRTLSMMWRTPLVAARSAVVTVALLIAKMCTTGA